MNAKVNTSVDQSELRRAPKKKRPAWGRALLAGAALGVLAMGGVALAGPHGPRGGGWFGPGIFQILNDLDLSEQQEVKAVKIRRSLRKQAKEARQEMQGSFASVIDELGKPSPDASKLHGIAEDGVKRFDKVIHLAIDQLLELHSTFTPEQRETLVAHARRAQERTRELRDRGERNELRK